MSKIIFSAYQHCYFFFCGCHANVLQKLLHPSQGLVFPSCFMLLFRIRAIVKLHFWNLAFANLGLSLEQSFFHNFYFQHNKSAILTILHARLYGKFSFPVFLGSTQPERKYLHANSLQLFKKFVLFIQSQHFKMQTLEADEFVHLRYFLFSA